MILSCVILTATTTVAITFGVINNTFTRQSEKLLDPLSTVLTRHNAYVEGPNYAKNFDLNSSDELVNYLKSNSTISKIFFEIQVI